MVASTHAPGTNVGPDSVQAGFLALLPRIRLHAQVFFRHLKCAHKKEEAVAEAVALAWLWYVRLTRRGKDASRFVTALAGFAARAARSGRRLCGQERARDVLSPAAQRRHGFAVGRLPDVSTLDGNPWDEALIDNTQSPIPDQACFRCDFPAWRGSRTDRDRRVIDALLRGERTQDVAREYGLSPSRVSQLRREFHDDWLTFCDELPVGTPVAASGSSPACASAC